MTHPLTSTGTHQSLGVSLDTALLRSGVTWWAAVAQEAELLVAWQPDGRRLAGTISQLRLARRRGVPEQDTQQTLTGP